MSWIQWMNSFRLPGSSPSMRVGGGAGEDQYGHPAPGGVVDRAAQVLGPRIDVHEHGLGLAGDGGVGVRRAEGDGLVRADDQFGQVGPASLGADLGERLDQARVVAAEVGEHVADSGFGQRFQKGACWCCNNGPPWGAVLRSAWVRGAGTAMASAGWCRFTGSAGIPADGRRGLGAAAGQAGQSRQAACTLIACSTRVTRVAFVDSRLRASHGMTGTSGEIASASLTSLERCGNWP